MFSGCAPEKVAAERSSSSSSVSLVLGVQPVMCQWIATRVLRSSVGRLSLSPGVRGLIALRYVVVSRKHDMVDLVAQRIGRRKVGLRY